MSLFHNRGRSLGVASAAAALCLLSPLARAHEVSTSYSVFEVEGRNVRVSLIVALGDLHEGPNFDRDLDGRVSTAELDEGRDLLLTTLTDHFSVGAPEPPPGVGLERYEVSGGNLARVDLVYGFDHDVNDLVVVSTLDLITQPDHRHLLQIGSENSARFAVLTLAARRLEIDYAAGIPLLVGVVEFVRLGVEHIFTGYDHLAFLAGLLLLTTTFGGLVRIVTFFTIAHSVTLVLATLGLVALPARFIESLIALSIAWVAIENFTGRSFVQRRVVTFAFGLVHGFGFSNVLREMGLASGQLAVSLASFNVGVEIGQLAFVAVLFPAVVWISRQRWQEHAIAGASIGIMCLGFYWFVQRAFVI